MVVKGRHFPPRRTIPLSPFLRQVGDHAAQLIGDAVPRRQQHRRDGKLVIGVRPEVSLAALACRR